jgi:hypothetical protein
MKAQDKVEPVYVVVAGKRLPLVITPAVLEDVERETKRATISGLMGGEIAMIDVISIIYHAAKGQTKNLKRSWIRSNIQFQDIGGYVEAIIEGMSSQMVVESESDEVEILDEFADPVADDSEGNLQPPEAPEIG